MNEIAGLQHQDRSRILPVLLNRGVDLPPGFRDYSLVDFSDFAFIGEGFRKSERYIDFQTKVRELARDVADSIETSKSATLS